MTTDAQKGHAPGHSTVRSAGAGAVGNILEWFDFAVYGYMAQFLGPLFFPSDDPLSSLLAVYGAFAAGYLARPLGAMVFGHLGDTLGRKFVLVASVALMGTCTVAIGLLPTAAQVGPLAGVLLVALRIMQGISVGGEYTSSSVFIAEHAPPNRRGFYCSRVVSGAVAGFLLGSASTALLSNIYTDDEIRSVVWRVPFLAGVIIMAVGVFMRRKVGEPQLAPSTHPPLAGSPVVHAFRYNIVDMLRVAGLVLGVNVAFYMMFVYAVSYLTERMHVSTATAMDINTLCLVVLMIVPLASGALSDKVGRKPLALTALVGLVVFSYPLFELMHHTDPTLILLGQLGFALLVGMMFGVTPALMVEILPRNTRVSALGIGYNTTLAIFGGTTPLVATALIERTGDDFSPIYYLIVMSAVSLAVVATFKNVTGRDLST